VTANKLQLY